MRTLWLALLTACAMQTPPWLPPSLPEDTFLQELRPHSTEAPQTQAQETAAFPQDYLVSLVEEQREEEHLAPRGLPTRTEQRFLLRRELGADGAPYFSTTNRDKALEIGTSLPAPQGVLVLPILGSKPLTRQWIARYLWKQEVVLQYRILETWKQSLAEDDLLTLITENCVADWYVLERDGSVVWSEVFVSRSIEEIPRQGAPRKSIWRIDLRTRRH